MFYYTCRSNLFCRFDYYSFLFKELGEYDFRRLRYDARKSRELVNMKILVSLDQFCLSYNDGFYSVSQSATYQRISTDTSCHNFSLKKTIGACSHRYVFHLKNLQTFWESPSRREENNRN